MWLMVDHYGSGRLDLECTIVHWEGIPAIHSMYFRSRAQWEVQDDKNLHWQTVAPKNFDIWAFDHNARFLVTQQNVHTTECFFTAGVQVGNG